MNINKTKIKKVISGALIGVFAFYSLSPYKASEAGSGDIVYPLKEVAKLECRFNDFDTLGSDCIEDLTILHTSDYQKYATYNNGYNDFTRRYTVLWGSSYKYGWDIGNGGHMGVDIATAKGTPVYSMSNGTVIVASDLGALGNTVAIKHNINGKEIVSSYSHLSKIEVYKGETVGAGRKIGEVGSTGNSTGNHLHFQIDTSTKSNPAYYSYEACPYSYNKISEEGVCFGELQKLTVDPLLFLETKGAVLNNMPSYEQKPNNNGNNNTNGNNTSNVNGIDKTIFNRGVNVGSSINDIKSVQNILSDLGYYKGAISGNYKDVMESVTDYQIARGVINSRDAEGSGNWGPSTRKQAKNDYDLYLASENNTNSGNNTNNGNEIVNNEPEQIYELPQGQIVISKDKLLTREEIEAMEVEEFMKGYNIDLKFRNLTSNVKVGGKEILDLTITDKKKGKPFVGNMPGGMTFIMNNETIDIFPTKLFSFTDGKREIEITGLKEGTTKLYIKVGTVTVKTFDINVYNGTKAIYPESAKLFGPASVTLGGTQTGITFFRDGNNSLLVNIPFGSTYKLKASNGGKVCIKRGEMSNIKSVVASICKDEDFKQEIDFTYSDTVGGILIYDYKSYSKNANFTIVNTYNNFELINKKVVMNYPKGLENTYQYKNDVITMLEQGVVSGINSGYFQQDNVLSEYDAYTWIKNSLINLNKKTTNTLTQSKIEKNIKELNKQQEYASRYGTLTRKQFLALSYKYLIIDNKDLEVTVNYKDLSEAENKMANYIFNKNTTWKDQYGHTYFQPDKEMTRGEGAYILSTVFNNYSNSYLTLK